MRACYVERAVVIGDPTLKVAGIGDTLALLSAQSGFSITDLAQRNRLTQANMLLVGQQLRMPQPFSPKIALHRVAPGETLLGIAARYGLAPYALQQMNKLPCADCLVAGQLLRIPQTKVEGNLPQPFTQIDIDPPAPIAGEVMSIRVYTSAPLKMLEGQIGKKTLPFFKKAEGLYIAITGIPALQQTEVVNIVLNASTDGDAKDADAPFEDEKFSWLAVTRLPANPGMPRVIGRPRVSKAGIVLPLCTPDGLEQRDARARGSRASRGPAGLGAASDHFSPPRIPR